MFCGKISNFRKRVYTHKSEPRVIDLIDSANQKNRKRELMNEGDHEHNMQVKKARRGELIISRTTSPFEFASYGPCPVCLEWMLLRNLGKHVKSCAAAADRARMTTGQLIVYNSMVTGDIEPSERRLYAKRFFRSC